MTSVEPQTDLSLTLSSGAVTAVPGATFAYTLAYMNAGPSVARNIMLTETVPAHTVFNPAASTLGWTCAPGNTAGSICSYPMTGPLAVSTIGTITFAVTVVDRLPAGVTHIHNTASIGCSSTDPNPGNNAAAVDIPTPFDNFIFLPSIIK